MQSLSGIYVERLLEVEVMDDFKETMPSSYSRADTHIDSQKSGQHTQDLYKLKLDKNPSVAEGR